MADYTKLLQHDGAGAENGTSAVAVNNLAPGKHLARGNVGPPGGEAVTAGGALPQEWL